MTAPSSERLHAAVCEAVSVMSTSPDIARSADGRKARDILRQALIDYADAFMNETPTDEERELVARHHRIAKRIARRP